MDPEDMTDEELVKYLAVEVMGWEIEDIFPAIAAANGFAPSTQWVLPGGKRIKRWNPLADANDRDMLVERMRETHGWALGVRPIFGTDWVCQAIPHINICMAGGVYEFDLRADTPGMAVCLAAAEAIQAMKGAEG